MKENALRFALGLWDFAKRYCFVLLGVGIVLATFTHRYQIAINVTESLPGSVFLIDKKDRNVSRGRYVAFRWQNAAPIPDGVTVIKGVAGVEGDRVTVSNRTVYINGLSVGKAKTPSRTRAPLTAITDTEIGPQNFYAAAEHPDSFDSRYANPGLIPIAAVRGRAICLW